MASVLQETNASMRRKCGERRAARRGEEDVRRAARRGDEDMQRAASSEATRRGCKARRGEEACDEERSARQCERLLDRPAASRTGGVSNEQARSMRTACTRAIKGGVIASKLAIGCRERHDL